MSLAIYRAIHLLGLFLIYISLGAQAASASEENPKQHFLKKTAGISHGLGMFLSLLGGFGLLAKLGIPWPWPLWVFFMLLVWLFLGGAPALVRKSEQSARLIWWIAIVLGALAALLGATKPF